MWPQTPLNLFGGCKPAKKKQFWLYGNPTAFLNVLSAVDARRGSPHIFHFFLLSLVFCVHGGPCHGDVCRFPAAELGAEVGGAAGDDRHLLTADRSFLHLTVCSLRHSSPQHGVSVLDVCMNQCCKCVKTHGPGDVGDGIVTFTVTEHPEHIAYTCEEDKDTF